MNLIGLDVNVFKNKLDQGPVQAQTHHLHKGNDLVKDNNIPWQQVDTLASQTD